MWPAAATSHDHVQPKYWIWKLCPESQQPSTHSRTSIESLSLPSCNIRLSRLSKMWHRRPRNHANTSELSGLSITVRLIVYIILFDSMPPLPISALPYVQHPHNKMIEWEYANRFISYLRVCGCQWQFVSSFKTNFSPLRSSWIIIVNFKENYSMHTQLLWISIRLIEFSWRTAAAAELDLMKFESHCSLILNLHL